MDNKEQVNRSFKKATEKPCTFYWFETLKYKVQVYLTFGIDTEKHVAHFQKMLRKRVAHFEKILKKHVAEKEHVAYFEKYDGDKTCC